MREPRHVLAETLSHIDSLLGEGQSREDALDVQQLSIDSGVPQDVVKVLLNGQLAPAEDITDRIIRRIAHLRETRRRPDGSRHSYDEIASSFGATRASLSNLVNSRTKPKKKAPTADSGQRQPRSGGPLASTQAGVERFFFGAPNGWLSAEPESALNEALQPVLATLRAAADPDASTNRRAVALRTAATLPDDEWQLVERFINTLVRQVREERDLDG